ncbi:unnamed protein product [Bursaphelenchus okinawaensis]|uniref:Uncharacterized protein n=1 Tax=Bursaphelenchus okinawaensis TaxID=465554 RepID=A0A811L5N1_9BILA|nr:unnamed protein product [Bursaphelenchus okinawaensis]CAG9118232.1 unnamed protein product [Bursaphelenchus okinawaensis]
MRTLQMEEWFLNFTQFQRTAITPETVGTVSNPRLEYALNTTFKSVQFSSFLGGCIVHPIYRIYKLVTRDPAKETTNTTKIIRNASRKLQGRILLAGLAVGPIIGYLLPYFGGVKEPQLKQLCYEHRISGDMLVWDRATVTFGFVGWYWKRFQGMVDGVNLALAYVIAYHYVIKTKTNVLLTDKFKPEELHKTVEEAEQKTDYLKGQFKTKDLFVQKS